MIGSKIKKTILITGINGYLGSLLAKSLKSNFNIIGIENSPINITRIKEENFKVYIGGEGIPEELFKENSIDGIIHTATLYGRNNESIYQIAQANLILPFILLDKAIENNCSFFINTDTVLDSKVSIYALTKAQFREWLIKRSSEICIINMQLEHFFGPSNGNSNFISSMIEKMKKNEEINLTAGEQNRDFLYIEDLISAYKKVIEKIDEFSKEFNQFEVCSGELIKIKELLLRIKKITNSQSILNFGVIPYRENELMISSSNNEKLKTLGWKPEYNIEKALIKTIYP